MERSVRTLIAVLLVAFAAGLVYLGSKRLTVVRLAHANVSAVPFTLKMEVSDVSSGSPEVFLSKTVVRRSDGSTILEETKAIGTLRTVTFMDGRSLVLSDLIRSRMSRRMAEQSVAALKQRLSNPPANCTKGAQRFKGNQMVSGEQTAILEHDVPDRRRVTTFQAPRLGCETLGYVVEQVQPDGSVRKLTEGRLTSLVLGEPDASLFDDKPNYTERRPSGFLQELLSRLGITGLSPETDPGVRKLDEQYDASNK